MADLTPAEVQHIAKLARLRLSAEEVTRMTKELSAILGYVEMLKEVDTTNVEPAAQVTGQTTVLREDVVKPGSALPDELLRCSPLPIIDHQIATPHAHG